MLGNDLLVAGLCSLSAFLVDLPVLCFDILPSDLKLTKWAFIYMRLRPHLHSSQTVVSIY